ncbi:MAG: S8 family peptidase [Saprospiraceae bacterium]|nr:S8 family peptidase [Saprospiraceae bacterium]
MIFIYLYLILFSPAPVTTDPLIQQKLKAGQSADILCILKTPWANPGQYTQALDSKEAKGNYIYSNLSAFAQKSQAQIINYLNQNHFEYHSFYIIDAIHIPAANAAVVRYLQTNPAVLRLEYNSTYRLIKPVQEVLTNQSLELRNPLAVEWGISRIGADSVWAQGIKGKGAVVGSEDTGVELHLALKPNYRGMIGVDQLDHNYNWHDAIHVINPLNKDAVPGAFNNPCGLDTLAPCDDNNHGTLTTGVMNASDLQTGVAPEAQWIGCRCMERGWGMLSTYIECFEWFLAPTDLQGKNPNPAKAPHVVNNSWGCPPEEGCNPANFVTMEQVISTLKAAGIFVAVAAGNDGSLGCSSIMDPASMLASSFSVGATAFNDTLASFSSRGPVLADQSKRIKPEISAPGVAVRSTIKNNAYGAFNGTSLASPMVAGAVALLISAYPQLSGKVELLEEILKQSAAPKFDFLSCGNDQITTIPNNLYGYGRLNVYRAYLLARQMVSTRLPNDSRHVSVKTYPNPGDQSISFGLDGLSSHSVLNIYDVQGRLWFSQKMDASTMLLPTSTWPAGMYFYQMYTLQGVALGKLVIQH